MDMVDIGCFIVRTDMAKQVGFRDKAFLVMALLLKTLRKNLVGQSELVN